MKNSLNIEITRPYQMLYVMRGISGGGKSTKARAIVLKELIFSTDDVIESMGDYREIFSKMITSGDFSLLHKAHRINLYNAKKAMLEGCSIVIDNTNLRANEPKTYVVAALELGLADDNIRIIDIGTGGLTAQELFERNSHGVPLIKIEKMIQTYDSVGELTIKKILESKDIYKNRGK